MRIWLFAGQRVVGLSVTVRVGASLSVMVTSWMALLWLPAALVAVHVTVVVPAGKLDGASLVTTIEPVGVQKSLTLGVPSATPDAARVQEPGSAASITAAGAAIDGGALMMVKLASCASATALLPASLIRIR